MDKAAGRLTVFFEDPFWVGVFERSNGSRLSAAKVTFGAEPKDYEIYDFVLNHYYDLQFSPAVDAVIKAARKNPKRVQRDIKKDGKWVLDKVNTETLEKIHGIYNYTND